MGNLFCEHLVLFSATFPTWGMMQDGVVYELPIQEHHTTVFEFSLPPIPEEAKFRTPSVTDSTGGAISEDQARERGRMVKTADQAAQLAFENGLPVTPAIEASLLPTPNTMEHREIKTPEQIAEMREKSPGGYRNLRESVVNEMNGIDWGKFEPAIRLWESILGRPAPNPTNPDGLNGSHRLSSRFTEWMMGLPEGWITDCGLSRKEELKACGNGVVPQQAALALRILLDDQDFKVYAKGEIPSPMYANAPVEGISL